MNSMDNNLFLIKQANFGSAASRLFQMAARAGKAGKAALNNLESLKDPIHLISKDSLKRDASGKLKTIVTNKAPSSIKRGVITSAANTAATINKLTEGVTGKGLAGGIWQGVKNVGNVIKDQARSDMYKEISGNVVTKNGKEYIKSKFGLLPDREILAKTDRGTHIVKKRLGPVSAVVGVNAPSVAISTYAFAPKTDSQGKRIKNSLVDGALMTVSPPIGIANSLFRGYKDSTQGIKQINKN